MNEYRSAKLVAARQRSRDAGYEMGFVDLNGCWHEEALFFLLEDMNWCCCGQPELAASLLFDALSLAKWRFDVSATLRSKEDFEAANERYEQYRKRELELMSNDSIAYFVWYTIDAAGLMEHGSSIPGWLTEKGKEMLEALRELRNLKEIE
jgi:hypothetical protein